MNDKMLSELTQILTESEAVEAVSSALHGSDVSPDHITIIYDICIKHIKTHAERLIDMIEE